MGGMEISRPESYENLGASSDIIGLDFSLGFY